MKKLVFVLAMALIGLVVFGQARTSDPSSSEFVLLAELTEATRWLKSEGEWHGNPNRIYEDEGFYFPNESNNFKAIRVYETTYVGVRYIVLEILYEENLFGRFMGASFGSMYKEYFVFYPVKFII
jgi:hypothetical protein